MPNDFGNPVLETYLSVKVEARIKTEKISS